MHGLPWLESTEFGGAATQRPGLWDLRQEPHPLLCNLHRPQEVGAAPPGWLLVGVGEAARG